MTITYVARVWRGELPEVQYRGELGKVRRKATRKLRQHISKVAQTLAAQTEAGHQDPLALELFTHLIRVEHSSWGGSICYRGFRIPEEPACGNYSVFVD